MEGHAKVYQKQSVQKGVPENGNTMYTSQSSKQAGQVKGLQRGGSWAGAAGVGGEYLGAGLNEEG